MVPRSVKDAPRSHLPTPGELPANVRAKAIDKLGFSNEAVKGLKPGIIHVHCVGFGSGGPYADLQAYDDVIQAASGTASLASRVDGDPRPRYLPSLIAEWIAGLHGAYAAIAAVIHRLRTGEGQRVEAPMFEGAAGARGVRAARGGAWHGSTVRNLLVRAG